MTRGDQMEFYTAVLRKSDRYWVALCLENGLVGQADSKEGALARLKEAIDSFEDVRKEESNVVSAPVSIGELHEFLTVDSTAPTLEPLELRALYA
jgi:predicted RNase H-like HicB family nuclease